MPAHFDNQCLVGVHFSNESVRSVTHPSLYIRVLVVVVSGDDVVVLIGVTVRFGSRPAKPARPSRPIHP